MAKAKPRGYATEGFAGAHQTRGLSPAAKEFLERKGAIDKPPDDSQDDSSLKKGKRGKKAKNTRPKASRTTASDPSPKGPVELETELPRRSRKARNLQARHFRLPLEIDAKLGELLDYYQSTMVWVVCKLIQDDWVRTRRALRRDRQDAVDDRGESSAEGAAELAADAQVADEEDAAAD